MKQVECNGVVFKVGDTVRIDRAQPGDDNMGSAGVWNNEWSGHMREYEGREGVIRQIEKHGVSIRGLVYHWPVTALTNLTAQPKPQYALKPFMRVVTRNGWHFVVVSHDVLFQSDSKHAPLFLVQLGGKFSYIYWPGEQANLEGALEIVEVYAAPEYINHILDDTKRGELLWTETMNVERAEKAALVARLQQQRDELDSRINELGAE